MGQCSYPGAGSGLPQLMTSPLRVGTVPYLNALPLVAALEEKPTQPVTLDRYVPSELLHYLLRGEVDVALLSSVACLSHQAGLDFVPGIAIACRGPVQSIKLVSRVPPEQIQTLALDRSSLTSVVLARILLRERYGVIPRTRVLPPDLSTMLAQADAAIIIGDPGLVTRTSDLAIEIVWEIDPGEEWVQWTGLPFVFAVWAYRRGHFRHEWADLLHWAKQEGLRHLDQLAEWGVVQAVDGSKVEGVRVNIFGGIMLCDVIAEAIVAAAKDVGFTVPLVVRLEGTNVNAARTILDAAQSELPTMQTATDLEDAAAKVAMAVTAASA